ncbi:MAG: DUF177 domain-containing protein [Bdellovibrionales bacterium]
MNEILESEWSHFFDADDVSDASVRMTITPDKDERKDLVRRLGILGVDMLKADLELTREQGGMVLHVKGHIHAVLKQACVVSLDEIETRVNDVFEAWFADSEQAVALAKVKHDKQVKANGETPIIDEAEDPEPIIEGKIDLGELVTQHLILLINPYPHKDGVEYEYGDDEPQKVPEAFKSNPFAALKDWKSKLDVE